MLKLLHKRRNPALLLHLYPRKGMGVTDLVMLIEILVVGVTFSLGYAVSASGTTCHSFVLFVSDQVKDSNFISNSRCCQCMKQYFPVACAASTNG